jgi:DNA-directed RNA polymerase subunit RPC12/RpoP
MECPKCKSKNLNFLPWLGYIYECRDCGYRGPVAVKIEGKNHKKLNG